jgi:hypothetical protein
VNTKKMTNQNKTLVFACWKNNSTFVCVLMEPSLGVLIMQGRKIILDEEECLFSFYFGHVDPCLVDKSVNTRISMECL